MDDIKVTITDNSKEVLDALQSAIQRGAEAIGEACVTHAKDNIETQKAVKTGRLLNSMTYFVKEE
jgi:hypothetical protein